MSSSSAALVQRLVDQAEVAVLEVAQAAVDQLGRHAAGAGGEVALVDEGDAQAAQGGVEGDAGAGDAAAEDEQVKGPVRERVDRSFHVFFMFTFMLARPCRDSAPL